MHEVRIEPGAPRVVRAGLQHGKLPAPVRPSKRGFSLVPIQHSAQAHKDWSEGDKSFPEDNLSETATSAHWNTVIREWETILAPIFMSLS